MSIGGLETLIFTAGIGENQPKVREGVCRRLGWLGLKLDDAANAENALLISSPESSIAVHVMATDEEQVIADEAYGLLHRG
jgi:acetate kinase